MSLRAWWPSVTWALLILVLCLLPGSELPSWDWADLISLDKPIHAFLFGVLTLLVVRGMVPDRSLHVSTKVRVGSVLVAVGYGVAMEVMQELEALGRHGDVPDAIANTTGAVAGAAYVRWRSIRQRSAGSTKVV